MIPRLIGFVQFWNARTIDRDPVALIAVILPSVDAVAPLSKSARSIGNASRGKLQGFHRNRGFPRFSTDRFLGMERNFVEKWQLSQPIYLCENIRFSAKPRIHEPWRFLYLSIYRYPFLVSLSDDCFYRLFSPNHNEFFARWKSRPTAVLSVFNEHRCNSSFVSRRVGTSSGLTVVPFILFDILFALLRCARDASIAGGEATGWKLIVRNYSYAWNLCQDGA